MMETVLKMLEAQQREIILLSKFKEALQEENRILREQVNRLTGENVKPVCALCKKGV